MPTPEIKTSINADLKTCLDLARYIDFYQQSLEHTNKKALQVKLQAL